MSRRSGERDAQVLAAVAEVGPCPGYTLMRKLRWRSALRYTRMYRSLDRLLTAGKIKDRWVNPLPDDPHTQAYRVYFAP